MSAKRREMHFGVFVLGTGNHSAGWRYDGAATSNNDLSVIQEIARHAERGKFDLLFVSDGSSMDPGTTLHPVPVRADHAHLGAERLDAAHWPRRHRVDQLRRALPRRRTFGHRPHHRGPGGLERGDELGGQGRAQLQPQSPHGARTCATRSSGVRRRREGPLGLLGGRRRSWRTRRPESTSTRRRSARSTIAAGSFRLKGPRSTWPVCLRVIRSSFKPAARSPARAGRADGRRRVSVVRSCRPHGVLIAILKGRMPSMPHAG